MLRAKNSYSVLNPKRPATDESLCVSRNISKHNHKHSLTALARQFPTKISPTKRQNSEISRPTKPKVCMVPYWKPLLGTVESDARCVFQMRLCLLSCLIGSRWQYSEVFEQPRLREFKKSDDCVFLEHPAAPPRCVYACV